MEYHLKKNPIETFEMLSALHHDFEEMKSHMQSTFRGDISNPRLFHDDFKILDGPDKNDTKVLCADKAYHPHTKVTKNMICTEKVPKILLGFELLHYSEESHHIREEEEETQQISEEECVKRTKQYIESKKDEIALINKKLSAQKMNIRFWEMMELDSNVKDHVQQYKGKHPLPPKFVVTMECDLDKSHYEAVSKEITMLNEMFDNEGSYASYIQDVHLKMARKTHIILTCLGLLAPNESVSDLKDESSVFQICSTLFRKSSGLYDYMTDHHGQPLCFRQCEKRLPVMNTLFHGHLTDPFQYTFRGKKRKLMAFATGPYCLLPLQSQDSDTYEYAKSTMKYSEI